MTGKARYLSRLIRRRSQRDRRPLESSPRDGSRAASAGTSPVRHPRPRPFRAARALRPPRASSPFGRPLACVAPTHLAVARTGHGVARAGSPGPLATPLSPTCLTPHRSVRHDGDHRAKPILHGIDEHPAFAASPARCLRSGTRQQIAGRRPRHRESGRSSGGRVSRTGDSVPTRRHRATRRRRRSLRPGSPGQIGCGSRRRGG